MPRSHCTTQSFRPGPPGAATLRTSLAIVVCAAALSLAGCGGGSESAQAGPAVDSQPTGDPAGGWIEGVFAASAEFASLCAAPRIGTDPDSGLPFADTQGTALDENNWLRSWSNELYLWYAEITDRDPADFTTPEYFDLLKTSARTPSGRPKDRFHFAIPTDEWRELARSGTSAGYGARLALLSDSPPRELVVAYTEPGGPAATAPASLVRGTRILEVDDVDLVNATSSAEIDILNAGLSPAGAGESHTFTVSDPGSSAPRTITMTSAEVASDPVPTVGALDTPTGKIGYLLFNGHIATSEQALIDAIATLDEAGIDDLVLDIRYNGGGYVFIASELAYMIAGPTATAARTFELMQFNDKHPETNPITGELLEPVPFFDSTLGYSAQPGQPLPSLDLPRVYVLTGAATCSASESIINSLQGIDVEVIQIGSTTCGKPYGFYPTDNCGTTYFSIQFQGVNERGFGDYSDGFSPANTISGASTIVPGCSVPDDFGHALGDPAESRLAAALTYRDFGTCPTTASATADTLSQPSPADRGDGVRLIRPIWESIRLMDGP